MARKKIPLLFFATSSGSEPVRDWLRKLPGGDCNAIGQDLARVQWRWPVGMPLCRSVGHGLWEVRTVLTGGRIARVIFCFDDERLVALHGFVKKTQKMPAEELKLAIRRRGELET